MPPLRSTGVHSFVEPSAGVASGTAAQYRIHPTMQE